MPPDDNLLAGLNLSQFSETRRQEILENLYKKLEDRVGDKMATTVSDEQFAQFESLIDQGDENKLEKWLSVSVPAYDQMVEVILQQLKQEVTINPNSFLNGQAL